MMIKWALEEIRRENNAQDGYCKSPIGVENYKALSIHIEELWSSASRLETRSSPGESRPIRHILYISMVARVSCLHLCPDAFHAGRFDATGASYAPYTRAVVLDAKPFTGSLYWYDLSIHGSGITSLCFSQPRFLSWSHPQVGRYRQRQMEDARILRRSRG